MKGTVKNVNTEKGFGFIKGEDGNEYFFHRSALPRDVQIESLSRGESVVFEVSEGPKGPRAENVERG